MNGETNYEQCMKLEAQNPTFAALIMAAMRRAGAESLAILRVFWPDIWSELQAARQREEGEVTE